VFARFIADACELHERTAGAFPATLESTSPPQCTAKCELDRRPVDPQARPYAFVTRAGQTRVCSPGPDGDLSTGSDDVCSAPLSSPAPH
jgi:hypothetical protein